MVWWELQVKSYNQPVSKQPQTPKQFYTYSLQGLMEEINSGNITHTYGEKKVQKADIIQIKVINCKGKSMMKGRFIILITTLLFCMIIYGCKTKENMNSVKIYYRNQSKSEYDKIISNFKIPISKIEFKLRELRQKGIIRQRGIIKFNGILIGDYYFLKEKTKIPPKFQGFLVNGITGEAYYINASKIILKPNSSIDINEIINGNSTFIQRIGTE